MARIVSISEEIEKVQFVPFPTKATKQILKIVRVERIVFGLLRPNVVACSRDLSKWAYPANNRAFPWMPAVIEGLFRLGVISKAAMDQHNADAEARGERVHRRHLAGQIADCARDFGLKLNARQHAALEAARKR